MYNSEIKMSRSKKISVSQELFQKEFQFLEIEWKEVRESIGRFDKIAVDLRKFGFSLITFLITASSFTFGATDLQNALPLLLVPFVIMILICSLFLADRYNEALLLGSVLRARQLEDLSQEILKSYSNHNLFQRLNLTSYLEDRVQYSKTRFFSFYIYLLFLIACFCLGIFSFMTNYKISEPIFINYFITYSILSLVSISFIFLINKTISGLISKIRNEVIIDDRILIKKLFTEEQISQAIKELALEINTWSRQKSFKILTIGIGGLQFAQKLIGELNRLKKPNIQSISVFSEWLNKGQSNQKVKIHAPEKHLINDENILIVDDLISTGHTLQELIKFCENANAKSIQSCILLDAINYREVKHIRPEFLGLTTTAKGDFVGTGMDINSECRALPFIGIAKSYKPKKI